MNASISSLVPHLFMRFMGYFNGIVIIIIIICGGRWKCHSDGSLSPFGDTLSFGTCRHFCLSVI